MVENASEGTDTAESAIAYTLTADVENLALTGAAAISGTGNTLSNVIVGNAARNSYRRRGQRHDGRRVGPTPVGGVGEDMYVSTTTVMPKSSAQTKAWIRYACPSSRGANVENLTLTGDAACGSAMHWRTRYPAIAQTTAFGMRATSADGATGGTRWWAASGNDSISSITHQDRYSSTPAKAGHDLEHGSRDAMPALSEPTGRKRFLPTIDGNVSTTAAR